VALKIERNTAEWAKSQRETETANSTLVITLYSVPFEGIARALA